jgi:hypothetical protein
MNHTLKALAICSFAAIVTGCGKSALTDAQLATFKEVQSSTNKVVTSGQKAQASKSGSALALAAGDTDEFASRISSASDCDFPQPDMSGMSSSSAKMNIKITGDKCPINMEIGISVSGTNATFRMFFEIKDEELAALSDVTKMDLAGTISANSSGTSASGVIEGNVHSKKHGVIPVTMTVEGDESSNRVEMSYKFADFTAVLEMETSGGETKYRLNGQELSAQEFQELSASGGLAGGSTGGTTTPPASTTTPKTPTNTTTGSMSYSYNVNDCPTGVIKYSSQSDLCTKLKDDALNNYCAESRRQSEFTSAGCTGSFN